MKRKLQFLLPALLLFFVSVLINGCRKDDELIDPPNDQVSTDEALRCYQPQSFKSEVAQQWYSLFLQLIKETPTHTPPVAARELGYSGIVMYESVIGGLQGHHSMAGQLTGLGSLPVRVNSKHYIATVTANAGMAKIIKLLMGNLSAANVLRIDSLETANEQYYASLYTVNDVTNSKNFGRAVADAVYNWSVSDGGDQAYLNLFPASYIPPTGVAYWVPTPPAFSAAMLPYWGSNRAFVPADNAALINPPAPPVFSTNTSSPMYISANLVYTTGVNLTQSQKDIASYWADGGGSFTPPGHSMAITLQIIRNKNLNLRDAAILIAKVGIGLNDAGIVCWRAKFTHSLLRPITYIKTYIDPNWSSFIPTPPFPSYTSGHSTFTSAAATILSKRFGNHFAFNDSTKVSSGFPVRSYTSLQQAAQEAAISRLYGGIHYDFDNDNGYNCGLMIANNISVLNW
ncbi:MAG: vanadium-dependent haloperoxidase [Bacteroidota bacterium]